MKILQESESAMGIGKAAAAHGCFIVRDCYSGEAADFFVELSLNRYGSCASLTVAGMNGKM